MSKKNFRSLEIVFLVLILLFAFFLRVYALDKPVLWIDESISASVSQKIIETGKPVLDSGIVYNRAMFFHYVQAFFILFGQTEFFIRIASVIFGLLVVFLAYKIGKEYSASGGVISALFFSVFYLEVFFSRQGRFYQLFQLLFFLCLYLLYLSKKDKKYMYFALIGLILCYDTHVAALVLVPFFIFYIIKYHKKDYWLNLIPLALVFHYGIGIFGLSSGDAVLTINYAVKYLDFAKNMIFMLILFVPGIIWAFKKNKELSLLLTIPSLIMLVGVFSLNTFALRYSYFFIFPLVLYFSLFLSFLYEKYGKIMIFSILFVLIFPSNLVFPHTYVTVLSPVDYNLNDYSAPFTDYRQVPVELVEEIKDSVLISFFSSDVSYYIKKPDYVIPFSMNGIGEDQISVNSSNGLVDVYSGSPILNFSNLSRPYYVVVDSFSASKLKPLQRERLNDLVFNCSKEYNSYDLSIYYCYF